MKPMKPCTYEPEEHQHLLRFPLLGSPKLDGFRCRVWEGVAMTNNWKPFVNLYVQEQLHGCPPVDGEIIVGKPRGPGVLTRTSSGVTSVQGEPDFTFWVFDAYLHDGGFQERFAVARRLVQEFGHKRVRMVPHKAIKNELHFKQFVTAQLLAEYEGAMFRDPHGLYKQGRSTAREGSLWRVKPFTTSEFRIEGWYELETNENVQTRDELGRAKRSSHKSGKRAAGMLGGFTGTDIHTGQPVRVGGGFSEAQRKEWWALGLQEFAGRIGTYSKQLAGEQDKPRHPNWVDFRDVNDL